MFGLDPVKSMADLGALLQGFTGLLALIISSVGVLFVWLQIKTEKNNQHELYALNTYADYIRMCIDKPEFSDDFYKENMTDKQLSSYEWFVHYCINIFERIVTGFSANSFFNYTKRKEWTKIATDQLWWHRKYLMSDRFRKTKNEAGYVLFCGYSKTARELIEGACK